MLTTIYRLRLRMNINKIISNGSYERIGTCLKFTFNFVHKSIDGYDMIGRPIYKMIDKRQVSYGMTKVECKLKARQALNIEKYEQRRLIFNQAYSPSITSGLGVIL